MEAKQFYVYIMTNASRTLYTGMTSDLEKRVLGSQAQNHFWIYRQVQHYVASVVRIDK